MEFREVMTHTTMLLHLAAAGLSSGNACEKKKERERERQRASLGGQKKKKKKDRERKGERSPHQNRARPSCFSPCPGPGWGRIGTRPICSSPKSDSLLPPKVWARMGVRKKKNICTPAQKAAAGSLQKCCFPHVYWVQWETAHKKNPSYFVDSLAPSHPCDQARAALLTSLVSSSRC